MSTPPPFLCFQNVAKQFGANPPVLADFSLTAARGEFVTLLGPSGSGKSTLLKLLAGLETVSSGAITIAGLAPARQPHELAYVFQDATLLPWLNVAANVAVPLKLRRTSDSAREAACARAIEQTGLAALTQRYPRELSGGQKMRVSLARALSLSPEILLLDEPFGALDEISRNHLNEELHSLRAARRWTTLFVTHSVAEAVFLSDRIIVLAPPRGRIVADIAVDLPATRTGATRLSPAYHDLLNTVSRALALAA